MCNYQISYRKSTFRNSINGCQFCQTKKWSRMLLLLCQHDTFPFAFDWAKIPDFEKCLDIVATLQAKKGSGEVPRIEDTDSVCLWLGANVMLEYICEQATTRLQKNLENAKASLEVLVADLQFLREQVTITRVTISRVYNWDVHQKGIRQAGSCQRLLKESFQLGSC
ncbi:hypothetical protein ACJRO7_020692 [Eucalyptus globulus]|uniref:Prefoldin subunit 3 n=1 Tax=Eucalyptus globulus TaxID=34317 RepID=A0ABD3KU11_EUCGL